MRADKVTGSDYNNYEYRQNINIDLFSVNSCVWHYRNNYDKKIFQPEII